MGVNELLDLLLRWFHVIAGIMWIGNSLLFNWLDRNLVKKEGHRRARSGCCTRAASTRSRRSCSAGPDAGHGCTGSCGRTSPPGRRGSCCSSSSTTWARAPGWSTRARGTSAYSTAVTAAVGTLLGGWVLYDLVWRSPLRNRPLVAGAICFAGLVAIAWGLSQVMTPRAAYIHVGVLLGTLMTGNVWMVIIPSQRDLVDATREGREQDRSLSLRAKQRSIHNNYMTFPLIFIMVSNHFPRATATSSTGSSWRCSWSGGALVRHFMNIRFSFPGWRPRWAAARWRRWRSRYALPWRRRARAPPTRSSPPDRQSRSRRCRRSCRCAAWPVTAPPRPTRCSRSRPTASCSTPPEQIAASARRIRVRVEGETMPFANRTHMTDDERAHRRPLGRPGLVAAVEAAPPLSR